MSAILLPFTHTLANTEGSKELIEDVENLLRILSKFGVDAEKPEIIFKIIDYGGRVD